MRVTVWGAGSFGTALAIHLSQNGHDVCLWDHDEARAVQMEQQRCNPRYLQALPFPDALHVTSDLDKATAHAALLVPCVPSHALADVATNAAAAVSRDALICCATKGIDASTLEFMPDVLWRTLGKHAKVSIISGPSFARELAQGKPTTLVVAGAPAVTKAVAPAFHGCGLRVYHSEDVVGVAVGGSLKNVIAIACGMSDGMGLGKNARAALMTRGLVEMTRLAVAVGGDAATLSGLTGMGDLVLTCTGDASRNRRVGLALGQGSTLAEVLDSLGEVAEGVITARSAWALACQHQVELPIIEQVFLVLHQGKPAQDGLRDLMRRGRKSEQD